MREGSHILHGEGVSPESRSQVMCQRLPKVLMAGDLVFFPGQEPALSLLDDC
jgi:hypothetical protein